jgi:hypothetical protein
VRRQSPLPVRLVIRTERPGGSGFIRLFPPMVRRTSGGHCGWPHGALPLFQAASLADISSDGGPAGSVAPIVFPTKLSLNSEQLSHRRVTAVLTFLRDAGLRG